jgi:hypothetical protein
MLSPKQFQLFTAVDKDDAEDKEFPSAEASGEHKAADYAYWMNSVNPGSRYQVRR